MDKKKSIYIEKMKYFVVQTVICLHENSSDIDDTKNKLNQKVQLKEDSTQTKYFDSITKSIEGNGQKCSTVLSTNIKEGCQSSIS